MEYLKCDGWKIMFCGLPEEKEKSIPTLLCMGNGMLGIRGTVPELENREQKGMFAAGFFDKLPRPELNYDIFTPFLKSWSYEEETKKYHLEEALVHCPDILDGYFEIEGEKFFLDEEKKEYMHRTLDMKSGETVFLIPVRTKSGRKGIVTRKRLVSMKRQEAVVEECSFECVNFDGEVKYHSWIDTDTRNFNISGIYNDTSGKKDYAFYRLYDVLEKEDNYVVIRGRCNGYKLYMADSLEVPEEPKIIRPGEKLTCVRKAVVFCERVREASRELVMQSLEQLEKLTYEEILKESSLAWEKIWENCDITIKGDIKLQTGMRHNLYLLNMSVCRKSDKVSVAAKGLTGEGYRGMVFWDTDIHMFPFFLYTQPEVARNLAAFRWNTLDGALEKANKYGYQGASFPWETGTSGKEECEGFLKLITHQLHITADVAYATGKYLEATMDNQFLEEKAAELFVETARFWLSKGYIKNGKFCIDQASGPDELHLESNNNAYVMNMVQHNFELASQTMAEMSSHYPEKYALLIKKTGLTDLEIQKINTYKNCVNTMKGDKGLFEQCEGFFSLKDKIVYENNPQIVPADTQTVKQADTIMCLYLLPELVNKQELLENWNYYEPRTTHTSSLSYGVHGIIAAKLGLKEKAKYYLEKSLGLDLFNPLSNCEDGAHLAAAGMSWSAVISGIAGLEFKKDGISLSPFPIEKWEELSFRVVYQGNRLKIQISPDEISILNEAASKEAVRLSYKDKIYMVGKGESICLCV